MHEVIFHFPCSIRWHGKAAGLCPRSSCISSPGKRFLRVRGQILRSAPAHNQRLCSREGSGPKPFSCTWAPRRRESALLLFIAHPPPAPQIIISPWLQLRGAGAGGRAPPLRAAARPAAPGRCVEPQRPLLGHGGTVRPAAAEGAPRWRSGERRCAAAERGSAAERPSLVLRL